MRLVILLAAFLCACAVSPVSAGPNTRDEVLLVAHAFDDAQRRQDAHDIAQHLAPDFRIIYSSGRVGDRDAFIAGFTSPTMRITDLHVEEPFYVDLGNDAAIVGGIGVIQGTEGGAPFAERFRFADTFARREGRWIAVYTQVTPLAGEAPAQR